MQTQLCPGLNSTLLSQWVLVGLRGWWKRCHSELLNPPLLAGLTDLCAPGPQLAARPSQPWHTTLFSSLGFEMSQALAGWLVSITSLYPQWVPSSSGASSPHFIHDRTKAPTERDLRSTEINTLSPGTYDEASSGAWGGTTHWPPQSAPAPKEGLLQPHFKDENIKVQRSIKEQAQGPQKGNRKAMISHPGLLTPRLENRPHQVPTSTLPLKPQPVCEDSESATEVAQTHARWLGGNKARLGTRQELLRGPSAMMVLAECPRGHLATPADIFGRHTGGGVGGGQGCCTTSYHAQDSP